jgi:SH3 domain protein
MKKYLSAPLLLICLLLSVTTTSAKNIYYVSDKLTIPMRSGTTNGHKILKFLNSGDALEVVETTDDEKHALVVLIDDESKTGWVETKLLMKMKSARDQLEIAKKKNQSIKEKQSGIKKQLRESQTKNSELQVVQARLEEKIKSLQNTLARLRKNASDPIRIADENAQLQQQLASAQTKAEELTQENVILGDQNIKSWFMIGAAVSIGSLILGIVLTRIRWNKNDRWA